MTSHVSAGQQIQVKPVRSALEQNLAVLAFGAVVLFAVGFEYK
jgi:hypothetical protein